MPDRMAVREGMRFASLSAPLDIRRGPNLTDPDPEGEDAIDFRSWDCIPDRFKSFFATRDLYEVSYI